MNEIFGKISSKDIRNILAVIIMLGCFILLYFLLIKEMPSPNRDVVMVAVGIVLGYGNSVAGYYFGASKTGDDKAKIDGEAK
jgi:hypothetical protein